MIADARVRISARVGSSDICDQVNCTVSTSCYLLPPKAKHAVSDYRRSAKHVVSDYRWKRSALQFLVDTAEIFETRATSRWVAASNTFETYLKYFETYYRKQCLSDLTVSNHFALSF